MLYPNSYFNKVENITIEFLQKNKIKVLILDIDNTLIDYKQNLSEDVVTWAKELIGQGTKLYLLSNTNDEEKAKTVANKLDVPYIFFAKKPVKSGFLKIQKELNEKSENIGVVGDQIFTDIIGGNRCKMYTILVDPIHPRDYWYTAWKRPIENRIKNKYNKKKQTKEKK